MEEGRAGYPKMMSVGLHCRLVGHPGRAAGLAEFMDFAKSLGKDVWICTREEIARHWYENHYPRGGGSPVKVPPFLKNDQTDDEDQEEETEEKTGTGESDGDFI